MTEQSLRYDVDTTPFGRDSRETLLDRLDEVLREATDGISASFTELLREALRGGVRQIDDEVLQLVQTKVAAEVTRRLPEFQDASARAAADEARVIVDNAMAAANREARVAAERLQENHTAAERRMQGAIDELRSNAEQWRHIVQDMQTRFDLERTALRDANARLTETQARTTELESRIAELEKPRGLRAFFAQLFGGKPADAAEAAGQSTEVRPADAK